ncbi:hypothetical protein [Parabacteroides pacaensis]|uniref:hypothetical protein n=1 Tax=Parabacteroides pacaensis TaxID=2086575 RepID=UPI001F1B97CD|nr:hypothetical protein [Parabacteroides pacaensis]
MNISIFNILNFFSKVDRTLFDIPATQQRAFLAFLKEPEDDIDRSYNQYLCQMLFVPYWKQMIFNAFTMVLVPFVVVVFLLKDFFINKKSETLDAIGECKGLEEIIPRELSDKYVIHNEVWFRGSHLSVADTYFLFLLIKRHPGSPYFIFKMLIKIAHYSYMLSRYCPKALIVHNEYSFTSSVLTYYCNRRNVLHINIMHGEKLFYIRDSFFRYDNCYVWNNYYKELFISLRAEKTQFKVAIPPSLLVDCDKYYAPSCFADYKYYLTTYTEAKLKSIIHSMEFAVRQGKKIYFRPHPRYSDIKLLESLVDKAKIEYPNKVSILTSIANLNYAVGSYTTVLNQAYFSGKEVVLDDMTFDKQYKKLTDYQYILHKKDCIRLSDLQ